MDFRNVDYVTLQQALAGFKAGQDGNHPKRDAIIAEIQRVMNIKRLGATLFVIQVAEGNQPVPGPLDVIVPVQRATVEALPAGRPPRTLDEALKYYGIASRYGHKGEEIIDFKPNRPSYPFSYRGAKGGRWKDSPERIRVRFGAVEPQAL